MMLSNELLKLKSDNKNYFSFYLKTEDSRIENDGVVLFHTEDSDIECGNGPLIYGDASGIINDLIAYIQWVLVSVPVETDLHGEMGAYFYNNCTDKEINNKLSKYMFTSGSSSIVWLYKVADDKYCIEVTGGSKFTPEIDFQKIYVETISEGKLRNWIVKLESSRSDIWNKKKN